MKGFRGPHVLGPDLGNLIDKERAAEAGGNTLQENARLSKSSNHLAGTLQTGLQAIVKAATRGAPPYTWLRGDMTRGTWVNEMQYEEGCWRAEMREEECEATSWVQQSEGGSCGRV